MKKVFTILFLSLSIISFGQIEQEDFYSVKEKADKGNAKTQTELAGRYEVGRGGAIKFFEKDFFYYQKAAEQGEPYAQCSLGMMYTSGSFIERSDERAAFWYEEVSNQEHPKAQLNLGILYYDGKGIERSYPKAI